MRARQVGQFSNELSDLTNTSPNLEPTRRTFKEVGSRFKRNGLNARPELTHLRSSAQWLFSSYFQMLETPFLGKLGVHIWKSQKIHIFVLTNFLCKFYYYFHLKLTYKGTLVSGSYQRLNCKHSSTHWFIWLCFKNFKNLKNPLTKTQIKIFFFQRTLTQKKKSMVT